MAKATYQVSLVITITGPQSNLPDNSQIEKDLLVWLGNDADTAVTGGYYESWEVESIEVSQGTR